MCHLALLTHCQALHRTIELEESLMFPLDNDGNTIAHLAAEDGHVPIFKVCTYTVTWMKMFTHLTFNMNCYDS